MAQHHANAAGLPALFIRRRQFVLLAFMQAHKQVHFLCKVGQRAVLRLGEQLLVGQRADEVELRPEQQFQRGVEIRLALLNDFALVIHPLGAARFQLVALGGAQLRIGFQLFLELLLDHRELILQLVVQLAFALFHRLDDAAGVRRQQFAIHARDDIGGKVEHLLQRARRQIEQQRHRTRHILQVPDVRHRRRQFDVPHALAPYLCAGDFHAAAIAGDAAELDLAILAAVTFPITGGAEDALAEQTVRFWFEGSIIDRFRLLHLAPRPAADLLRRSQPHTDLVKIRGIYHTTPRFFLQLRISTTAGESPVPVGARPAS
ncbi:MAG: hypothetical protein BWY76_00247 [bacterium ADurb.Bin429]|nr:MAG: hypothetical protein BWY76_00247 [bacterium ADurb.Bin429]